MLAKLQSVALRTGLVALVLGALAGALTALGPRTHQQLSAYSSSSASVAGMLHSHDFAVLYRLSLVVAAALFAVSAMVMSIATRRSR